MPSETRVGQIVHISRGYTVAEIVQSKLGDTTVLGYSVFGHRSDTARLFETKEAAIAELTELANASARFSLAAAAAAAPPKTWPPRSP